MTLNEAMILAEQALSDARILDESAPVAVPVCGCGCGNVAKRRFLRGHQTKPTGERHGRWVGGRYVARGYVWVLQAGHPRANRNGYVLEHILVVERALGKFLPLGCDVHRVDENKARNVGGNLIACEDRAYHALMHQRQRALDACGNANALRCPYCKGYDRQDDIVLTSQGKPVHRSCRNAYNERYKVRRVALRAGVA